MLERVRAIGQDTGGRALWLLALLLVACRPVPSELAASGLRRLSAETVGRWMHEMAPRQRTRYGVRWTYQTQQGSTRGRAAIRVAPPDSLRFDYRGPFGRSGAAVVFGGAMVWAEPEEEVEQIIPVAPLFLVALGIPREPPAGASIWGVETDAARSWQYGEMGDTLSYVVTTTVPFRLQAAFRQGGDVIGMVEVQYDDHSRVPEEAVFTFPTTATRIIFQVLEVDTLAVFPADTWRRP